MRTTLGTMQHAAFWSLWGTVQQATQAGCAPCSRQDQQRSQCNRHPSRLIGPSEASGSSINGVESNRQAQVPRYRRWRKYNTWYIHGASALTQHQQCWHKNAASTLRPRGHTSHLRAAAFRTSSEGLSVAEARWRPALDGDDLAHQDILEVTSRKGHACISAPRTQKRQHARVPGDRGKLLMQCTGQSHTNPRL